MQDGAYPPRNYATLGPLRIQPPLTIVLCEYDPQLLMYAVYYNILLVFCYHALLPHMDYSYQAQPLIIVSMVIRLIRRFTDHGIANSNIS